MRRNIWIPDALWALVVKAAARETLDTGESVSVAEWVRRAIKARLGRS